jgi:hypothetical protein
MCNLNARVACVIVFHEFSEVMVFLVHSLPIVTWPDTDPPSRLSTQKFRQIINLLLNWAERAVYLPIRKHRQYEYVSAGRNMLGRRTILLGLKAELDTQKMNSDGPSDILVASQKVAIIIRRVKMITGVLYVLSEVSEPLFADRETIVLSVTVPRRVRNG